MVAVVRGFDRCLLISCTTNPYLLQHEASLPADVKQRITDRLGLVRTKIFDSHPSDADRIRQARRAGEPGVFHLQLPATILFSNFEAVSKQVTLLHYSDDLRLGSD